MTRSQAIRLKCLDCSDSFKEVTLCHVASCPLWQYRFGNSLNSNAFKKRMNGAKKRFPVDFKEMLPLLREELKDIGDKTIQAYVARFIQKNE